MLISLFASLIRYSVDYCIVDFIIHLIIHSSVLKAQFGIRILPFLSLNLQGLFQSFDSSTQEQIIETSNEINIAIINWRVDY